MTLKSTITSLFLSLGLLLGTSFKTSAQGVDTVCFGAPPAAFVSTSSASGSLGSSSYLYEWQDSTAVSSWAAAPGVNNTINYQAVALTQNTWFRRQVSVMSCMEQAFSNVIEVRVLDSLVSNIITITNASCDNTSDGSAEVAATGGLPGYTYSWSNGSTTNLASGLAPGSYTVTITDSFGCTTTQTATVGFDNPAPILQFAEDTLFFTQEEGIVVGAPGSFDGYQWSTGATDSATTVSETGYLLLTVTNSNGCSATDSVWIEITVGVIENIFNQKVRLFPNPARESVRVEVGDGEMPDRVEIRNLQGQLLQTEQQTRVVDLSNLASGVYLVNIHKKEVRHTLRLIVQ